VKSDFLWTLVPASLLIACVFLGAWLYERHRPPKEVIIEIPREIPRHLSRLEVNQLLLETWMGSEGDRLMDFYIEETGSREVALYILTQALAYEVPVHLAFALCQQESNYLPTALNGHKNQNKSKDIGLFQLNTRTFSQYTQKELFDPMTNAHLGVWYLKSRSREYQTWEEALMAYNSGYAEKMNYNSFQYMLRIIQTERRLDERFNEWVGPRKGRT